MEHVFLNILERLSWRSMPILLFLVSDSSQKSTIRTQTKGLRQGCPLSPYLFGFVLTHLFHDVEIDYQAKFGEISVVFHVPSPLWD